MGMLSKIINTIIRKDPQAELDEAYRNAIREEAKIGALVFGPVPEGVRREFFCLDKTTWVWHEEWADDTGKAHIRTTRYDVRPNGIYKAQNSQPYQPISAQEVVNFKAAVNLYYENVMSELEPLMQHYRAVHGVS